MRFPTMWYVRPAKAQTSLRICAVWSEHLQVAKYFMSVKLLTKHYLQCISLKEAVQARTNVHLSKCHIVGNHMSRLSYKNDMTTCRPRHREK